MKASQLLRMTADWMKTHAWCKGSAFEYNGKQTTYHAVKGKEEECSYCAFGALIASTKRETVGSDCLDYPLRALGVSREFGTSSDFFEWQDSQKCKEDVIAALLAGAKLAESEGQ